VTKYIVRRVIQAIPVLIGITIVVYGILLSAPGG
jgi:ABC-type dipeptide/oligopeptide/nickel transport system permease component